MEDYSKQGFKRTFELDGVKTYASVNTIMESDGARLLLTGTYFVYFLHPLHGGCLFTLELDDNAMWKSKNSPEYVDQEIIDMIGDSICARNF